MIIFICLSWLIGLVSGAKFEYKHVPIDSLYLKYRTSFILASEEHLATERESFVKFEFLFTLANSNPDDLADKLAQVTIFPVEEVYKNSHETSLSAGIANNFFCCIQETVACFEPNILVSPEILTAGDSNSDSFYFDFESADIDFMGNLVLEANGYFPVPSKGLYALMISYCEKEGETIYVDGFTKWSSTDGLLPGELFGYLSFYGNLSVIFLLVASVWGFLSYRKWRQLLLIQNWISFVLILSMVEVLFRYFDFHSFNEYGVRNQNLLFISLVLLSLKKALSRVLVYVVATGFGAIKPSLGEEKNRLYNIALAYFTFCMIESIFQSFSSPFGNELHRPSLTASKLLFQIPLLVIDAYLLFWIFKSLSATLLSLEKRGQTEKFNLYVKFRALLQATFLFGLFWALLSGFVKLSLPQSWSDENYENRMFRWDNIYILEAVWDVVYLIVLLGVMILWIPSENSLKYSYSSFKAKKDDEYAAEFDDGIDSENAQDLQLNPDISERELFVKP